MRTLARLQSLHRALVILRLHVALQPLARAEPSTRGDGKVRPDVLIDRRLIRALDQVERGRAAFQRCPVRGGGGGVKRLETHVRVRRTGVPDAASGFTQMRLRRATGGLALDLAALLFLIVLIVAP